MKYFKQNEKDMSMTDVTGRVAVLQYAVFVFLAVALMALYSLNDMISRPANVQYRVKNDTVYIIQPKEVADIPLTDSAILAELVRQKCVLPNVALSQFKIESLHFRSAICKENKNFAGIRTSSSSYVKGKNRGHCVYETYRDCIKDYIRIQNRYLNKIDGFYAESPGYISAIRNVR